MLRDAARPSEPAPKENPEKLVALGVDGILTDESGILRTIVGPRTARSESP